MSRNPTIAESVRQAEAELTPVIPSTATASAIAKCQQGRQENGLLARWVMKRAHA